MSEKTFLNLPRILQEEFGDSIKVNTQSHNGVIGGYHLTLPDNHVISVQCHPGTYSSHHYADFDEAVGVGCALSAEIAHWYGKGDMEPFPDGDIVLGYQDIDDVMVFIRKGMMQS